MPRRATTQPMKTGGEFCGGVGAIANLWSKSSVTHALPSHQPIKTKSVRGCRGTAFNNLW
ncbi:hypothetical protein [Microseira sp. BLCC-F43]|uniref:hypothetical protein n=1 Tax=Microseira sp. BLCC-F43 TaxID=3153602 RepID=UPI0035B84975